MTKHLRERRKWQGCNTNKATPSKIDRVCEREGKPSSTTFIFLSWPWMRVTVLERTCDRQSNGAFDEHLNTLPRVYLTWHWRLYRSCRRLSIPLGTMSKTYKALLCGQTTQHTLSPVVCVSNKRDEKGIKRCEGMPFRIVCWRWFSGNMNSMCLSIQTCCIYWCQPNCNKLHCRRSHSTNGKTTKDSTEVFYKFAIVECLVSTLSPQLCWEQRRVDDSPSHHALDWHGPFVRVRSGEDVLANGSRSVNRRIHACTSYISHRMRSTDVERNNARFMGNCCRCV